MPAPMTPLGAFQTIWAANSDLADLVPDGLWSGEIPEEKVLPLVALIHEGEKVVVETSEAPYIEETNLCFEIYASYDPTATVGSPAKPVATVEKIGLAIKAAFDRETVTVNLADMVGMWREKYEKAKVEVEPKEGPSGERVGKMRLPYSVWLQRNYPR